MFDDTKNYVAPSATVLNQQVNDPVKTSSTVDWGFDDSIFDLD